MNKKNHMEIPHKCPICNEYPMVWGTPDLNWHCACKYNNSEWHENIESIAPKHRLESISIWNNLVEKYNITHNNVKKYSDLSKDSPVWLEYDGVFYQCSNCGYILAPKTVVCPSCGKFMRFKNKENK